VQSSAVVEAVITALSFAGAGLALALAAMMMPLRTTWEICMIWMRLWGLKDDFVFEDCDWLVVEMFQFASVTAPFMPQSHVGAVSVSCSKTNNR
jgi:hypothetical protein